MERTLYESTEYRGYTINIYYDECPESPRQWDNLGTFYTAHRRYCPEEQFDKHFDFEEVCDGQPGVFRKEFLKNHIVQNIYLYDHSGQTVSTTPFGCRWDSGWFGMVAVSVENVKKEYGWKKITKKRREQIEGYLKEEVETYDHYLTGSVYGYEVVYEEDGDVIDSCWSFYGDEELKNIEKECQGIVDRVLAEKAKGTRIRTGNGIYMYVKQLLLPFPEMELEPETI